MNMIMAMKENQTQMHSIKINNSVTFEYQYLKYDQPIQIVNQYPETIVSQKLVYQDPSIPPNPIQQSLMVQKPVKLSFYDIKYQFIEPLKRRDRKDFGGKKSILRDLLKSGSGYALPGQATYIIGQSVDEQTALLNLISDRGKPYKEYNINRKVFLNDRNALDYSTFNKIGAFVAKEDILFEYLTPREAIRFAARLKLKISEKLQNKRVEQVLTDLRLISIANSKMRISRKKTLPKSVLKRTALGMALISNPSLVLLDEPTNSMENWEQLQFVQILQHQANFYGRTILSTIHQPTSDCSKLFDNLVVMTDGHIIFQGSMAHSVRYFNSIGFFAPENQNPLDYYISHVSTILYPKNIHDERKIQYLINNYQKCILPDQLQTISNTQIDQKLDNLEQFKPKRKIQLMQLIGREVRGLFRNPGKFKLKIIRQIIVALLIIAVFSNLGGYSKMEVSGMTGFLFFVTANQMLMHMFGGLLTFQVDRPLVQREYDQNFYGTSTFFIAKVLVEQPMNAIETLIIASITYWQVGCLSSFWNFTKFCYTVYLLQFCGTSWGFFISLLCRRTETAVLIIPIFIMPLLLIGGFFANITKTKPWIRWIQYISPIRYGSEALTQNEFHTRPFPPGLSPLESLGYHLGYAKCMIFLLILGLSFYLLDMILLKIEISSFLLKTKYFKKIELKQGKLKQEVKQEHVADVAQN
eukprot:403348386